MPIIALRLIFRLYSPTSIKKSKPTEEQIDEHPNLVRRFLQLLDRQFPWFKPFPNQFHRLSQNFFFMTVDNNCLGVKSLEGLEKGNCTTMSWMLIILTRVTEKRPMLGSLSFSD